MSTPPSASDLAAPSILTSIVATIGPASDSPEMVKRLILGGVGVFRFNFSHGDHAGHQAVLDRVRKVRARGYASARAHLRIWVGCRCVT